MQNNATNAYYGTGTSLNNNNKNNTYGVVPIARYNMTIERLTEDMLRAYYDCRRNKTTKTDFARFEIRLEDNITTLALDVYNRKYEVSPSKAFVVNYPVKREIFAADFRDRVIHHYIGLRIEPLIEKEFIEDSYNCRKGKGTNYGVERLTEGIRKVSNNWKESAWCLSLDIRGFFMSIDKDILFKKIKRLITREYRGKDEDILLYLLEKTIYNKPQENCVRVCSKLEWVGLKADKSLFSKRDNKGIAIGNLTSQLLANYYLSSVDKKMASKVGFYCRYVDDIRMIDKCKKRLKIAKTIIDKALKGLGLRLHSKKSKLIEVHKGVKFIGTIIMPYRTYITNRVVNKCANKIISNNMVMCENIQSLIATINSYFGIFKHYRTYRIRERMFALINNDYKKMFYGTKNLYSVKLNDKKKGEIFKWQEYQLWAS